MLLLTTTVFAFLFQRCTAQFGTSQWISPVEVVPNGTFAAYRSSIAIPSISHCNKTDITLHIAADTKYWLYVNGNLAVFEGGLKRGPNPNGTYYDEVNIPYLLFQNGKNTIAILALYLGRRTVPEFQTW